MSLIFSIENCGTYVVKSSLRIMVVGFMVEAWVVNPSLPVVIREYVSDTK